MEHKQQQTTTTQKETIIQRRNNEEKEYIMAQRAAVESVEIGRETLEVAVHQGEQLEHAETLADETNYKLDKSARILRGMTWSGWVANMFAKEVVAPPKTDKSTSDSDLWPVVYEDVPSVFRPAAQAVQNYHCNLLVLEECEDDIEQRNTCMTICDNMYAAASIEMNKLSRESMVEHAFPRKLVSDLKVLRYRHTQQQKLSMELSRQASNNHNNIRVSPMAQKGKLLFGDAATTKEATPPDTRLVKQEEHLNVMSQNLGELNSIAGSLSHALEYQNNTIEALTEKSDAMIDKTRMVTRRADRLIQSKSWSPVKKDFHGWVIIRHITSGKYLAVSRGALVLSEWYSEACEFGLWRRQGEVFGLLNRQANRWVGQTFIGGQLACAASSFGRREEWETDEDWGQTRLICASAGFGNGGYLMVRTRDEAVFIGSLDPITKKQADMWVIADATIE